MFVSVVLGGRGERVGLFVFFCLGVGVFGRDPVKMSFSWLKPLHAFAKSLYG